MMMNDEVLTEEIPVDCAVDGGDGEAPRPEENRRFDLEERTFLFAQNVRKLAKRLRRTIANVEDIKQVVRSSGSAGANYIEANESLSRKDFVMRIKICRKEAKESAYFLRLLDLDASEVREAERAALVQEATELTRIFSAILRKTQSH